MLLIEALRSRGYSTEHAMALSKRNYSRILESARPKTARENERQPINALKRKVSGHL